MYEILYSTGLNKEDEGAKQITYDEAKKLFLSAQNQNKFGIICSYYIEQIEPFVLSRSIRYLTYQIIAFDDVEDKELWYQKISGNEYFLDKVAYHNYEFNNQKTYVELNFRDHNFSMPNICMIKVINENDKDSIYYIGNKVMNDKDSIYCIADIDDKFFYRTIGFDDTDIIFKDFETSFKTFLHNIRRTDANFETII